MKAYGDGGLFNSTDHKARLAEIVVETSKPGRFKTSFYSIDMPLMVQLEKIKELKKRFPEYEIPNHSNMGPIIFRNYDYNVIANCSSSYVGSLAGHFVQSKVENVTFSEIRSIMQNRFSKTRARAEYLKGATRAETKYAKHTPFAVLDYPDPYSNAAKEYPESRWSVNCVHVARYAYLAYAARQVSEAAEHYVVNCLKEDLASVPIWLESQGCYESLVSTLIYYQIDIDTDSMSFISPKPLRYGYNITSRRRFQTDLEEHMQGHAFFMACLKGIKKELAQHISQGWSSIEVK
jgi:hypothetical protein